MILEVRCTTQGAKESDIHWWMTQFMSCLSLKITFSPCGVRCNKLATNLPNCNIWSNTARNNPNFYFILYVLPSKSFSVAYQLRRHLEESRGFLENFSKCSDHTGHQTVLLLEVSTTWKDGTKVAKNGPYKTVQMLSRCTVWNSGNSKSGMQMAASFKRTFTKISLKMNEVQYSDFIQSYLWIT